MSLEPSLEVDSAFSVEVFEESLGH